MAFSFSPVLPNYADLRYLIIRYLEEKGGVPSLTAYTDSKGYATIGAGFLVQDHAQVILARMGYLGDPNLSAYAQIVTAAVASINFGQGAAGAEAAQAALDLALQIATGSPTAAFRFANEDQVKAVFADIAQTYEGRVNNWLPGIPQSRERLALLSLSYNGVLEVSQSLKAALQTEDRAWAWFEI
jgi:hypothetical protein